MTAPLNQTMTCRYGVKPYYDPGLSGDWTIAFDGDQLSLTSFAGGSFAPFGGLFSSGTTSNGVPGVERENYDRAALIRTFLGGGGANGQIYLVKSVDGTLLSAGHNAFGGSEPRADSVECGGNTATQWTPTPTSTPFTNSLSWGTGTIPMNCASRTGDGSFGPLIASQLVLAGPDAIAMQVPGQTSLFALASYSGGREATIVASGRVVQGGEVSVSRPLPGASDEATIILNLSAAKHPTQIVRESPGGENTTCWPSPVDRR